MSRASTEIHPVILSGGSGTRLWPLSRASYPKQLLALTDEKTLLQQTIERAARIPGAQAPQIVCNQDHRFLIREQLQAISCEPHAIYIEPAPRNTAPAIALAALHLAKENPHAVMLVLPADHVIQNQAAFERAVELGAQAAKFNYLVTFGITPTGPETGYGYIQLGEKLESLTDVHQVESFVEKPDKGKSQEYVNSGTAVWNSGMFMFTAEAYLQELKRHRPVMFDAVERAFQAQHNDLEFIRPATANFDACPSQSIDYAVMQETNRTVVVPTDLGWSDIGSWDSLWKALSKDSNGNVIVGDVHASDTRNSYLRSERRLVTVIGLDNVAVIETPDAVLVIDKNHAQRIKDTVTHLNANGRNEANEHLRVHRPWGWYEGIDHGHRFKVKRLMVRPGESLSLQMHHHRAEHWVVVSGTAQVTLGETEQFLAENESTYIPIGKTHRLANLGKVELHMIEVQSGTYLGEDDIVRIDDNYGRIA